MTREEAHTIMEDLQRIFTQYRFMFSDKLAEANGMAILALEKQREQKKGYWIGRKGYWIGRPIAGYATVRCSVCKDVFCENEGRWKFCPHCGAKMEEEEERRCQ